MKIVTLHNRDCLAHTCFMPDNSVDSVVTDPPYALTSIVKRFGEENAAPSRDGDVYSRASAGFMGQKWDTGRVAFDPFFWSQILRVLKPGGHLLAFGGSRTYHRLTVAVEDAGFEIRDQIMWLYGSGFPKSHDQGDGWGTALKPAHEPIVMARKPFKGSVGQNLDAWGVGGINIDGCRIGDEIRQAAYTSFAACSGNSLGKPGTAEARRGTQGAIQTYEGRWPANVIHDGSDEVVMGFPDTSGGKPGIKRTGNNGAAYGVESRAPGTQMTGFGDSGSAARFFYCAKASKADREEGLEAFPIKRGGAEQFDSRWKEGVGELRAPQRANIHPTVKPTDLMRYLCRLVTPAGGLVYDPFMGSGSTGKAAVAEGFSFIGVDQSEEYFQIARQRIIAAGGIING